MKQRIQIVKNYQGFKRGEEYNVHNPWVFLLVDELKVAKVL